MQLNYLKFERDIGILRCVTPLIPDPITLPMNYCTNYLDLFAPFLDLDITYIMRSYIRVVAVCTLIRVNIHTYVP